MVICFSHSLEEKISEQSSLIVFQCKKKGNYGWKLHYIDKKRGNDYLLTTEKMRIKNHWWIITAYTSSINTRWLVYLIRSFFFYQSCEWKKSANPARFKSQSYILYGQGGRRRISLEKETLPIVISVYRRSRCACSPYQKAWVQFSGGCTGSRMSVVLAGPAAWESWCAKKKVLFYGSNHVGRPKLRRV